MSQPTQPITVHKGIGKLVLSGDSVVIRGQPRGGPPPEKTISLSGIIAPKLARRGAGASQESKDEPFAWEAREFLRRKIIGKELCFVIDYVVPSSQREYGFIYIGKDSTGENVAESLVAEGLVDVRQTGKSNEMQQKLSELADSAKAAGKGKWGVDAQAHIRDVKWTVENAQNFVDSMHHNPIKAIVEHVRDGSTVRAILLPDFYSITLLISGIRCPMVKSGNIVAVSEPFGDEAKFFTESRLLQREVEIILESSPSNQNFAGSILHPNGNIAELLLREGFAKCIRWSMASVSTGPEKLRAAEKQAKEKKLRIWKDYTPSGPAIDAKDREFQGKVTEIINADALVVKLNDGMAKKIFLASIRPPRLTEEKQGDTQKDNKGRNFRPLYEIPHMFEAREFLRKKLVGKRVNVTVDYIQPASNNFQEKTCCTVTIGGINVAETLVGKGLATVVKYRQDDDQRSTQYNELLTAETKAQKSGKGIHCKKDPPVFRVVDLSGDPSKSKQFLPFLQRAGRSEAVVEFVASGSRMRLFVPRENCQITFLLAGISCPRASRQVGTGGLEGEPFGDEALSFTKDLCLQREVEIEVESMDKAGNFIGWLWFESNNLSVALVQEGLASVHVSAERSIHCRALQNAEDDAKRRREKMWAGYEEPKEQEVKDENSERKVNYKSVVVTEVRPDLHFYAQHTEDGKRLEELMEQLRQEFSTNPPLVGSYTPRKGDLCAAKFVDDQWYRAKVEKVTGNIVSIFYVDYGNKENTESTKLAALPGMFVGAGHAAHEYVPACVSLPKDGDIVDDARHVFTHDTDNQELLLNVEYTTSGTKYVTLVTSETKDDIILGLVNEGLLLVEKRKENRLQKIVADYKKAEEAAKQKRLNIWCYGDITEDDAKEFG